MAIKPENIPEPYRVTISLPQDLFTNKALKDAPWLIDPEERETLFAAMPEDEVNLSNSADWEKFIQQEGGETINSITQFLTDGFTSIRSKEFSTMIWKGTGQLETSVDLRFMTYSDPFEDVIKPSMTLLSLTLPSQTSKGESSENFFLKPPVSFDQKISLDIGNYLTMTDVLVTNVDINNSPTMCTSPKFENKAFPLFADVSLDMLTKVIPTKEEPGFEVNVTEE